MMRLCPAPRSDEVFASWIQRVAAANGLELRHFVKALREHYAKYLSTQKFYVTKAQFSYINPNSVDHKQLVALMVAATGLTEGFLQTLILKSKAHGYAPRFLAPVGRIEPKKYRNCTGDTAWYPDSYCPDCLAGA